MRTQEEIDKIKSRFSKPYTIYGLLTDDDIKHLVSIFKNSNQDKISGYEGKIKKNTGPVTLGLEPFLDDPVIVKIFNKLKEHLGEFEMNAGFFFETDYPHIIHNDDTFDLKDVYKGITIPLMLTGDYTEFPKMCFFDQYYFGGPAKFFAGEHDIPTYYNKQIYEYSGVEGITQTPFDKDTYNSLLTHLRYAWLSGLSLQEVLDWKPSSAIVFDSVQLHSASDFRKLGIKSKMAISIFTRIT